MNSQLKPNRDIYSISRLVRESRAVIEGSFPLLWVEGEISNLARPASGHIYFTLKDQVAQVRCAMFRIKRQRLRFQPQNGQQVLVRARVSLYEARGEFQLNIEHMEPAGEGALRQAFDRLKAKLAAEGLFYSEHKQPLPRLPRQIGLITSPSGAALRDLLTVLARRFPAIPLLIHPVQVQGDTAAQQIVQMLQLANRQQRCDLLILARGGGSLEDLQPFNDERVARAIFDSQIPLITGIGHEIDFTIADFVADQRAATPSAAAELASPEQVELRSRLNSLQQQLQTRLRHITTSHTERLRQLSARLQRQHPQQHLSQLSQRLDELRLRLRQQQTRQLDSARLNLAHLQQRLQPQSPLQRLVRFEQRMEKLAERLQQSQGRQLNRAQLALSYLQQRLQSASPAHQLAPLDERHHHLQQRLQQAMESRLEQAQGRLAQFARDLHNLSPLTTLERGFAIVSSEDGTILRDAAKVTVGDQIETRLARGRLRCRVLESGE
ncbi:exodeoxyribonuclease VII large subunit [Candidatus Endoriftia persephonae]|jgi:exodeoxyribonuclease VII large subunit|uniref:Exodeoxyribonuclease 7 large subunit n=2 Tax=Gammaproteobacteria TaxID=1236 RepID=G2FDK3_9GAMM|nr:exodeoxyribonuclease VII large subunit [Candidatus Endoriftia persephone]EGW55058.1 exodeoxyribonuclease VII large subunit [endosymbiont of Tevnia jerichonana (vent Tica)]USF88328.1 exodeoxyribonuclease VII large subunit [Candidatus Endoriftia persephone]